MTNQKRKGRQASAACFSFVLIMSFVVSAAEPQPLDKVEAAFVFKFAKFCEWPDDAFSNGESFRIGVAAFPSMVEALNQAVAGKTVNDKAIKLIDSSNPNDLAECHIVFLGGGEAARNKEILDALRGKPILTIGDGPRFIEEGGMIYLFEQNKKLRFDIQLEAARESDLKISSKVLDLATRVVGPASSIEEES